MDKYVVVVVRKNVDGKRDYLQVDTWACGSPILLNQQEAVETVTRLNEEAHNSEGFEEISGAFSICVGSDKASEARELARSIKLVSTLQSAQLQEEF